MIMIGNFIFKNGLLKNKIWNPGSIFNLVCIRTTLYVQLSSFMLPSRTRLIRGVEKGLLPVGFPAHIREFTTKLLISVVSVISVFVVCIDIVDVVDVVDIVDIVDVVDGVDVVDAAAAATASGLFIFFDLPRCLDTFTMHPTILLLSTSSPLY